MKLVLCYTVFNGLELLEKSIQCMYDHVDSIVICYQSTSNTGQYDSRVEPFVFELASRHEKINVCSYNPQFPMSTKEQERRKHSAMIDVAKKLGATHYILSACDHFYTAEDIERTKQMVLKNDIDVTVTRMKTYYKHPTWQLDPMETYFMPFISKMYPDTKYVNGGGWFYPVKVDPSVMVNTSNKILVMHQDDCIMHHFSMIRTDIENKFSNAAASIRWKPSQVQRFIDEYNNAQPGSCLEYFGGRKIIEVENLFKI